MFVPTSVHYICRTCAEAPLFATRVTALVFAFKDSFDIQVGYSSSVYVINKVKVMCVSDIS